jgi:hypothetical protein
VVRVGPVPSGGAGDLGSPWLVWIELVAALRCAALRCAENVAAIAADPDVHH